MYMKVLVIQYMYFVHTASYLYSVYPPIHIPYHVRYHVQGSSWWVGTDRCGRVWGSRCVRMFPYHPHEMDLQKELISRLIDLLWHYHICSNLIKFFRNGHIYGRSSYFPVNGVFEMWRRTKGRWFSGRRGKCLLSTFGFFESPLLYNWWNKKVIRLNPR